jgi:hypothetical protein
MLRHRIYISLSIDDDAALHAIQDNIDQSFLVTGNPIGTP